MLLATLYCLNFFPISFLESLRVTDHPEGRGPFEDMPGECSVGGLPGPLPAGLPGFFFFMSGPAWSILRFLPGLASGAGSLLLVGLSLKDLLSSLSSYDWINRFRFPALLPESNSQTMEESDTRSSSGFQAEGRCVPTRMSYPESSIWTLPVISADCSESCNCLSACFWAKVASCSPHLPATMSSKVISTSVSAAPNPLIIKMRSRCTAFQLHARVRQYSKWLRSSRL